MNRVYLVAIEMCGYSDVCHLILVSHRSKRDQN
jgi:hypothetical protein